MSYMISYARGSPSSTITIDGTDKSLDCGQSRILADITRCDLPAEIAQRISKYGIISPSSDADFDLDYRFLQASKSNEGDWEMRGNCGHSMLAATVSAIEMGIVDKPNIGDYIKVRSLNTDTTFLCELAEDAPENVFNAHMVYSPSRTLKSFLPLNEQRIELPFEGKNIEATIIDAGNPYIFVLGDVFNARSASDLFALPEKEIERLEEIRKYAQKLLKFPEDSAFPKISMICPGDKGGIAARAIYQDTWHPSLALTGTIALTVARNIKGTLPFNISSNSISPETIETAQGSVRAKFLSNGNDLDDEAEAVVIKDKRVVFEPS